MSFKHQLITVGMIILATLIMRFIPFLIFPDNKPIPPFVQYLGKVLPAAVFGLLIVYCLKNVSVFEGNRGVPELIAIIITARFHLWKKQMLISISVGTISYMLLVQFIF